MSLWQDLLKPFLDEIGSMLLTTIGSLLSILESDRTLSIGDLLKQASSGSIVGLIGSVGKIVVGVLRVVGHLIDDIKKILNEPLQGLLGVFGNILSRLGINLPSLLDIICFIIAIPTTLIRKITGGKRLCGLPAKLTTKEMEESIGGTLKDSDAKRHRELTTFSSDLGVAMVPVLGVVDLGKIALSAFTAGSGIAGPPKLRKIEGGWWLVFKGIAALLAWPRDPTIPGYEARKLISFLPVYDTPDRNMWIILINELDFAIRGRQCSY